MIKRSSAIDKVIIELEQRYREDPCTEREMANRIATALESAGVEFAPEEPESSAVEKWNRAADDIDILTFDEWEKQHHDNRGLALGLRDYGNVMRDELQARISDLESQVDIIADENQTLEKRIEEKDAEIERLQQSLPESPELVKLREKYYKCRDHSYDGDYITALESEIAKLRGAR
jgi:hypothetical protein